MFFGNNRNNQFMSTGMLLTTPVATPTQHDVLSVLNRHKVYLEQAIVNAKKIPTFMGYISPVVKTNIMSMLYQVRTYQMQTLTNYLQQANQMFNSASVMYDNGRYLEDVQSSAKDVMQLYVKLSYILDNKNTETSIKKFLDENRNLYDLSSMK